MTEPRPLTTEFLDELIENCQRQEEWIALHQERLLSLTKLEVGWDGRQGKPVSVEHAFFALRILGRIYFNGAPPAQIVPSSDGSVQLEWHTRGADLEVHIMSPHNAHVWMRHEHADLYGEDYFLTDEFAVIKQQLQAMTHAEELGA
jgi:hypothetical protein